MNALTLAAVALLQFHGVSVHSDDYPYNEENWGMGVQLESGWAADAFLDSYGEPAYMVGRVYDHEWRGLTLGVTVGAIHHSTHSGPIAVPHATYREGDWGIKAHLSPTKTGSVMTFSLVWDL